MLTPPRGPAPTTMPNAAPTPTAPPQAPPQATLPTTTDITVEANAGRFRDGTPRGGSLETRTERAPSGAVVSVTTIKTDEGGGRVILRYNADGRLHDAPDGTAAKIEEYYDGRTMAETRYQDGREHAADGIPARQAFDERGNVYYRAYMQHGVLTDRRDGGAAVEWLTPTGAVSHTHAVTTDANRAALTGALQMTRHAETARTAETSPMVTPVTSVDGQARRPSDERAARSV